MKLVLAAFAAALLAATPLRSAAADTYVAFGKGTLTIAPDGSVADIDLGERFGNGVDEALVDTMRGWRFEPIIEQGRAVEAVAHMEFLLQAEQRSSNDFRVHIDRVAFVDPPSMREPRAAMAPPSYPREALRQRVGAVTELQIAVDRDGRVVDAAPLDGWLLGARPGSPARFMRMFNEAAQSAVRQWTLHPCSDAELCHRRVPIRFLIDDGRSWARAHRVAADPLPLHAGERAQALGADGTASSRVRLLTPTDPAAG